MAQFKLSQNMKEPFASASLCFFLQHMPKYQVSSQLRDYVDNFQTIQNPKPTSTCSKVWNHDFPIKMKQKMIPP